MSTVWQAGALRPNGAAAAMNDDAVMYNVREDSDRGRGHRLHQSPRHTINATLGTPATSVSGNTASLKLPADRGVLVPGSYLLFVMDNKGVPSVASTIRIS
jgi:hypothetical protein